MNSEEWRPVPGLPGYEVSDQGRVLSRHKSPAGRLMRFTPRLGYLSVGFVTPDGGRMRRNVHQVVALAFIGPRPVGLEVRHLDGDRTNNRLDNLAYGTKSENMRDRIAHGRNPNVNTVECPRGHAYDEANTYRHGSHRYCRPCNTEQKRINRERRAFRAAGISA